MKATEAPGEDPALQEGAKLPFHEYRPVRAAGFQAGHEGLQVFLQHLIEHRRLGFSPFVYGAL
jgi:hypothetical protein